MVGSQHYSDVIMSAMASQITDIPIVCSTVCSSADQRKGNTKAPRHWPLWGESTGDQWFPSQRVSNAENVSIWWRHYKWIFLQEHGLQCKIYVKIHINLQGFLTWLLIGWRLDCHPIRCHVWKGSSKYRGVAFITHPQEVSNIFVRTECICMHCSPREDI